MIIENIDLNKSFKHAIITRVCDECGKKEPSSVIIVLRGRKARASNVDLCKHCSNIGKYRKMPTGINSGHWKHGISAQGYNRIHVSGRGRVLEHVLVMESILGRKLVKNEVIHHIDMNKRNNDPSNLFLMVGRSSHRKCHRQMEYLLYPLLNTQVYFDYNLALYTLNKTYNTAELFKLKLNLEQINELSKIKTYGS